MNEFIDAKTRVDEVIKLLHDIIDNNCSDAIDEYGSPMYECYQEETIDELLKTELLLSVVTKLLYRIHKLVNGDDSELSFHVNLNRDMAGEETDEE